MFFRDVPCFLVNVRTPRKEKLVTVKKAAMSPAQWKTLHTFHLVMQDFFLLTSAGDPQSCSLSQYRQDSQDRKSAAAEFLLQP